MKKLLPLIILLPAFAHGTTLTVTSLNDDGSVGTLRALCASAADGDEIVFDDSLAGGTIALTTASGPITFAKTLSIVGPADAPITIDGQGGAGGAKAYDGSSRTTNLIYATDPAATLTLRNLVFTGSKCNQASATPEVGPAVSILGSAVIDNCCWTNNGMAQTGGYNDTTSDGGGCLRVAGDLSLFNSAFVSNGVNGCNLSSGGTVMARGANVVISNCVFHGAFGWGGSTQGGNVRGGGTIGLGPDVADFAMTDCLVEKATAGAATGGILLGNGCSGSYRFRNCAFRDIWSCAANWRPGGAVSYHGSNAITMIFENVEFSHVRYPGWAGAVHVLGGNSRVVFANTTFVNCYGNEWGSATETRCNTCFVNCTAVGNVNGSTQANGGTFFCIDKPHYLLNTACVWNWDTKGSRLHDTSCYNSTLGVYNSYNHSVGNGPSSSSDNAMGYDSDTVFFSEPFVTLSALVSWTGSDALDTAISSPVLTVDENAERRDPAARRVVAIDKTGVLFQTGWPVKHDANWENIAYSQDGGATWTALVGQVADATIPLAADSRGEAYPVVDGVPVPPIGSATVPLHAMMWDVGTNGGTMEVGGATVSTTASTTVFDGDAPVPPGMPVKSGFNFVGWNTDPDATTALDLSAVSAADDTTYYAIFEEISATDAIVEWFDDDGLTPLDPASTLVAEGAQPTHTEPTKAAIAQYTYTFAGWTLVGGDGTVYETADLPAVTGGTTFAYKAVYTPTLRSYTIVFKDNFGTVFSTTNYDYGTTAAEIVVPTVPTTVTYEYTYTFANWDATIADVTGDATYTAVYDATANTIALARSDYRYRMTMTASGYDGESTLTNFPVLVRLGSSISGFDVTTVSNPSEIRFADAAGNLIPHEIDTWNTDGESTIWVSVPLLSGTSTAFSMYWMPASGATQQAALTSSRVWTDAGYLGVWHFSPATSRVYANSAQAEHYATASADATVTNGIVGGCVQFSGGATTYVKDSEAWRGYTPHMTLEFWVDRQNTSDARIFGSGNDYTKGASVYMSGYISGNGGHSNRQSSLIPDTGWRHVSMNFSGSAQANALADGTTSFTFSRQGGSSVDGNSTHFFHNVNDGSDYADFHAFSLTSHGSGAEAFKGYADEFRVRGENSTTEWMQANYDTQAPGTDFLTYGKVRQSSGLTIIVR